jgi:uncharacterized protein YkwD
MTMASCIGNLRSIKLFRREPSLKTIPEEGSVVEDEENGSNFCGYNKTVRDEPAYLIALERHQRNLSPYQRSMELDVLARMHAHRMALHAAVFHSVPSIQDLQRRLQATVVGENIIRGDSVYRMHQETMSTPTASVSSINRSNIISKQFTEFGSAIVMGSDGKIYCCQYFRRRSPASS